ncbi:hypothetical protein PB2503_06207 [Parvularcula bermudensis HTCC2503]|uniref:UDP-glucose 4-epimerase n=1 Tax=Parvularcula bermudensis (strain ATCC BAA-594 / HTCC2503 / KCTC 12087) TaxID=314260 RepID=E0THL1_PARBH|nr:hypothetical protein PB2503_06207 [Parvularcula bermudensis HTCC2503]
MLVTGGAGFIGSHMVLALLDRGEKVVVVDDLSTGSRQLVPIAAPLVRATIADIGAMRQVIRDYGVTDVIHFAGSISVPESIRDPLDYYANNTVGTQRLAGICREMGVARLIFSSTAAVYAAAACDRGAPVAETAATDPASPYGRSKLMAEDILRDSASAYGLSVAVLRYFNVAGADPHARAGQINPNGTHLLKVALDAALGRRGSVSIYGTDYPTADGTGVRDYIHVSDLIEAHLLMLDHLRRHDGVHLYNCGYGQGVTVRQLIEAVEMVVGRPVPKIDAPRREGDLAQVVADASRLVADLGWRPRYDRVEHIVAHALQWEMAQERAHRTGWS